MMIINKTLALCLLLSVSLPTLADDDDYYRHEHYGEHRFHDDYDRGYGGGYPQPVYVQPAYVQPVAPAYYPPQPVAPAYYSPAQTVAPGYYAPPPRFYGYQQPSPQGLLGQVIGGAMAYEMSNGNPVAAGIGAAAGAMLGHQMNR